MIRPFTFCTMITAALAGAYLFGVKHRAQVLDDQLAAVTQASRLDDQRIAVLQAQWSLEIDHNRLQGLAQKFSTLQSMKPVQLVTLAQLAQSLPPAGSAAPEENPVAPMPVSAQVAAAPVSSAPVEIADAAPDVTDVENPLPLPPPEPPAPVVAKVILASAAAEAPRKRMLWQAPHATQAAAKKTHFEDTELAENLAVTRPVENVGPAKLVAVNAVSTDDSGQGGSMLGIAADVAPPQPLSAGNSN